MNYLDLLVVLDHLQHTSICDGPVSCRTITLQVHPIGCNVYGLLSDSVSSMWKMKWWVSSLGLSDMGSAQWMESANISTELLAWSKQKEKWSKAARATSCWFERVIWIWAPSNFWFLVGRAADASASWAWQDPEFKMNKVRRHLLSLNLRERGRLDIHPQGEKTWRKEGE